MEARLATRGSNTVSESAAKKELIEENNKVYLLEFYSLCLLCLSLLFHFGMSQNISLFGRVKRKSV